MRWLALVLLTGCSLSMRSTPDSMGRSQANDEIIRSSIGLGWRTEPLQARLEFCKNWHDDPGRVESIVRVNFGPDEGPIAWPAMLAILEREC